MRPGVAGIPGGLLAVQLCRASIGVSLHLARFPHQGQYSLYLLSGGVFPRAQYWKSGLHMADLCCLAVPRRPCADKRSGPLLMLLHF